MTAVHEVEKRTISSERRGCELSVDIKKSWIGKFFSDIILRAKLTFFVNFLTEIDKFIMTTLHVFHYFRENS